MKLIHLLVAFAVLSVGCILILHFTTQHTDQSHINRLENQYDIPSLLQLIRVQNETIHTLEQHLKRTIATKGDTTAEDAKLIEISDTIGRLSRENEENRRKVEHCHNMSHELEHNFDIELQQAKISALSSLHCPEPVHTNQVTTVAAVTGGSSSQQQLDWPTSKLEDECEARYGLELADLWRKNGEVWCASDAGAEVKSELKCYPYHQAH
jgi:hypothetical protein